MCSVAFNLIAVTCVLWAFYVLIEKTREEVKAGKLRKSGVDRRLAMQVCPFRMVILDEAHRCGDWIYRRTGERMRPIELHSPRADQFRYFSTFNVKCTYR